MNNNVKKTDEHIWAKFPKALVKSGKWSKLKPKAMAVYGVLLAFANIKTRNTFVTVKTISELSGISVPKVSLATKELVECGLIKKWGKYTGRTTRRTYYNVLDITSQKGDIYLSSEEGDNTPQKREIYQDSYKRNTTHNPTVRYTPTNCTQYPHKRDSINRDSINRDSLKRDSIKRKEVIKENTDFFTNILKTYENTTKFYNRLLEADYSHSEISKAVSLIGADNKDLLVRSIQVAIPSDLRDVFTGNKEKSLKDVPLKDVYELIKVCKVVSLAGLWLVGWNYQLEDVVDCFRKIEKEYNIKLLPDNGKVQKEVKTTV